MDTKVYLVVRVPIELKRQAKAEASLRGMSLQDWVAEAIRAKLTEGRKKTQDKAKE